MKVEFINQNISNRKLILVYSGWSTGPAMYRELRFEGWDVAVVYDYRDLELELSFLDRYATVMLFAWSLGVVASAATLSATRITGAYAINGTLRPVSDTEGIPESIYHGTRQTLSARNLMKFRRRMCGDGGVYARLFGDCAEADEEEIESLKIQLDVLEKAQPGGEALPWRRVYVGEGDRIFPVENMVHSWQKESGVRVIRQEGGHYIPLEDVISSVIPDQKKIELRFAGAQTTYDDNAVPQRLMAARLIERLESSRIEIKKGGKVLEIGIGTGLLTREYACKLEPSRLDAVDLVAIKNPGMASDERIYQGDAEEWISRCEEKYDYILSSSTIQWFSNPGGFIRECYRCLEPGGVLVISTFLPGTMAELDSMRPSPIDYRDMEYYRSTAETLFGEVEIFGDEIQMEFNSPRELLMHLKLTGVGGSAPSPGISASLLRNVRRLTYCPIYLLAKK